MENFELLEPIKLYETKLKEEHHELVIKTFDELVKKSSIDIEANKITCDNLHKKEASLEKNKKGLSKLKGLLVLFILLIIFGTVLSLIGAICITKEDYLGILWAAIGVGAIVGGIILIIKVYKAKKRNFENIIDKLNEEIAKLKDEAYSQMAPLNALFEGSMPAKLFQKTCPLIEMDRIFDVKKYELLREKYDFWDNSEEGSSTLDLQSGSILGNPFVVFKDLDMEMVEHVYTGTLVIHYTRGSGNNKYEVTETLRATYKAPAPVYSKNTYLVYANEGAKKLSFSRTPSKISSMSEDEIRKYVRKHEKDLDKYASEQLKRGGKFTPIGNPEFELFFGGLDRDDEVEFRVLFTALGQKSMMDLLKSKVGYGDDFSFRKIQGLNIIQSEHSQGDTLFTNSDSFKGFEFVNIKDYFINFNDQYFKALFFDFAPLLSIPLYQQYKTHDFIYKDVYKSNYAPFVHEVLSNKFDVSKFAHQLTKTDVILKTNIESRNEDTDVVKVTAHSFDSIPRVTYVPVMGGDGCTHNVPVEWNEYVPLTNESTIEINDLGVDDEVKFKGLIKDNVIYANGLVSKFKDDINVDIKQLKSLMKKD